MILINAIHAIMLFGLPNERNFIKMFLKLIKIAF